MTQTQSQCRIRSVPRSSFATQMDVVSGLTRQVDVSPQDAVRRPARPLSFKWRKEGILLDRSGGNLQFETSAESRSILDGERLLSLAQDHRYPYGSISKHIICDCDASDM